MDGRARHDSVPEAVRKTVAEERWAFSHKVEVSLDAGEFSVDDLQCCVLQGWLDKRERDEHKTALDGWKYTIHGHAVSGLPFYVCGKLKLGEDDEVFFFITAHQRR